MRIARLALVPALFSLSLMAGQGEAQTAPAPGGACAKFLRPTGPGYLANLERRISTAPNDPNFLSSLGNNDKDLTDYAACRETVRQQAGEDLARPETISRLRGILQQKVETIVATGGARVDESFFVPSMGIKADQRTFNAVAGSPVVMGVLQQRKPQLAAQILANQTDNTNRQQAALAAGAARDREREALAAKQRVQEAAIAALPQTAGPWRRTGQYSYTRSAPGGITANLFCDRAGGLALNLATTGAGQYFVAPEVVKALSYTDLWLTSEDGEKSYHATLAMTGSEKSTGFEFGREVETTTYYYDNTRALFAMNVPAERGKELEAGLTGIGRAGTAFAEAAGAGRVPDNENAMLLLLQLAGKAMSAGLQADNITQTDIASVKTKQILKVSVRTASPNRRVELFDLSPRQAPFKSLMDACWGG